MVKAIAGGNWGDEGKGKITDLLAGQSDIVVRYQGGSNAGHTIINAYGKFALHLLPSGVFQKGVTNVIAQGVALNIPLLFKELDQLVQRGVPMPSIKISDRAQLVMPYHILLDQLEENRLGDNKFGSTRSGIITGLSPALNADNIPIGESSSARHSEGASPSISAALM